MANDPTPTNTSKMLRERSAVDFAVKAARLGIWELDPGTNQVSWDDRCRELFGLVNSNGLPYDQALNRIHPDDRERVDELVKWAMNPGSGGEYDSTCRIIGAHDGLVRWVRFMGQCEFTAAGEVTRFAGVAQEVTKEVQDQQRQQRLDNLLSDNQQRLQSIFEHSPVAFALFRGPAFIIELANERVLEYWSRERDEVINKPLFEALPEVNGQGFDELLTNVYTTGERFVAREIPATLLRKGKLEQTYLDLVYEPFYGTDGNADTITGVTVACVEVTGQVLARQKLQHELTERKRREANQTFLAQIVAEFEHPSSADEIMTTVGAKIGAYLAVKTCQFIDVDEARDEVHVFRAWNSTDGLSGRHSQTYRISEYITDDVARAGNAGQCVSIRDIRADSRMEASGLAEPGVGAFVTAPFHHNGVWTNYLAVTDSKPRDWREDEVGLVREIANRIFPRLERVRTEEALHRQQDRTRIAIESADMGTWEWNLLTDAVYWNEQHFWLFGMEPRRGDGGAATGPQQPLSPDEFMRHVHPDDLERIKAALERTIREKVVYDADFRAVRDDGTIRWMNGYGRVTEEKDGQAIRVSGVILDIDDRKRTDDGLRASEERFRTLVQNLPDYAIFRIDPTGLITEWTEGAGRVTGYTADEVIGRSFALFYTPEGLAAGELAAELAEATQTGRAERENVHIRKGGERFWVDQILTAIHNADGQLVGFTKISRDITERKRAETARLRSEEQLRIVLDSITEHAIITTDTEAKITGWNPGAQHLFGWTADEAIGQAGNIIFTPEDRVIGEEAKEMATAREQGKAPDERYHLRKDGSRFYVSGVMSPLNDAAGQLLGYVKVARDLTQRQQMEQTLREADRRKDEFMATLAHELRNPLAPISNTLQRLKMTTETDETVAPAVTLMARQVDHLIRLVDDLLDVSRISQGKLQLRPERIELTELIRQVVDASGPLYDASGRELTVALPVKPIYLRGDATRLAQIVSNLLNNAAKFTREGGHVWLSVERVVEDPDRRVALLRVRDNGIGIAADQLESIFGLFNQVDSALERSRSGLGLGLTLVRQLVELHGGRVEALSDGPERGSEFRVYLPVPADTPAPRPAVKPENQPTPTGRLILVIDDNPDAATTLAMLLKLKGHQVHTRNSGLEGIAAAESLQPELILLDIGMPGLNGYDTCRRIRQQPWGRSMLLVALTGFGQDEDKLRSREAGFDGHLVKPVDLAALIQLLNALPTRPDTT